MEEEKKDGIRDSVAPCVKNEDVKNSDVEGSIKKDNDTIIPTLDENRVSYGQMDDIKAIDKSVRQNAIESDRDYRKITNRIIDKTSEQLNAHTEAKKPLRMTLMWFVIGLLATQFTVLVCVLFLNRALYLQISDYVVNVYIVSLFVETLTGLIIMIKFAFDAEQEVQLIKVLNAIIRYFKKYDDK